MRVKFNDAESWFWFTKILKLIWNIFIWTIVKFVYLEFAYCQLLGIRSDIFPPTETLHLLSYDVSANISNLFAKLELNKIFLTFLERYSSKNVTTVILENHTKALSCVRTAIMLSSHLRLIIVLLILSYLQRCYLSLTVIVPLRVLVKMYPGRRILNLLL